MMTRCEVVPSVVVFVAYRSTSERFNRTGVGFFATVGFAFGSTGAVKSTGGASARTETPNPSDALAPTTAMRSYRCPATIGAGGVAGGVAAETDCVATSSIALA